MKVEREPGDDRLKGLVLGEGMQKPVTKKQVEDVTPVSQFTGEKVPGIGVLEPGADISDRTEEGGSLPAVQAAQSVEEEIKVERNQEMTA